MKVLFISYDGLTDPLGQSQIIPYLTGLQRAGHDYSVLSFEKANAFEKSNHVVKKILNEAGIHWFPLNYTKKPPILSTLKDVKAMSRKVEYVVKNLGIEVLHCRSYISMFAAFPIAKRTSLKLIFDMRGFWIDERVEGNLWSLKNPIYAFLHRFLKKNERRWMTESDLIVSLTETGKNVLLDRFQPRDSQTIHVIPCCADEGHFDMSIIDESAQKALRAELNLSEDDVVLAYSGSIGTWYLADEMMQQFNRLQKNGRFTKFLWITRDSPERIFKLADSNGVDRNKIVVHASDRASMPLCLSLIDLGIFYIKPSFSKKASSPTKLGELLLMGIPVLCNNNVGDLNDFFQINKVGICHDIVDLQNASIEEIEALLKLDGSLIRKVGLQHFSLEKGISLYREVLNDLS